MNKIPVKKTIAEAYRFTFHGLEKVIGLIWLPTVVLTVGSYFVMSPYLIGMAQAAETGDITREGPQMAMMFGFELAALLLVAMIGVAVTREILNPLQRPLFLRFGLGGTEFRVVGAFIGLYVLFLAFLLICVIVATVLGFAVSPKLLLGGLGKPGTISAGGMALAVLAGLCLFAALVYFTMRLAFLMVPAVVMEGKFGIERSWQLTKGNVWRIIAISLAVALPVMLVSFAGQAAILGADYFNPHLELFGDPAASARHSAATLHLMSDKLPLLIGLNFLLAPFLYGLTFSTPAFAYRALTAGEKLPE